MLILKEDDLKFIYNVKGIGRSLEIILLSLHDQETHSTASPEKLALKGSS
jgi:hypothetical protein